MKKNTDILTFITGTLIIITGAILACLIWAAIIAKIVGASAPLSMLGGFIIGIATNKVYEKLKDK